MDLCNLLKAKNVKHCILQKGEMLMEKGRGCVAMTEREKQRSYAKYLEWPMKAPNLEQLEKTLEQIKPEECLSLANLNDMVINKRRDYGWCIFEDGSSYVSSVTKMPGVTIEMVEWWFCWHGMESLRYAIWDPRDHYKIAQIPSHTKKRLDKSLPIRERIWGTSDYVYEDNGAPIPWVGQISFHDPAEFGIDKALLEGEGSTAICANTNIMGEVMPRSTFIHYAKPTEDGIELHSYFWPGWFYASGKLVRNLSAAVSESRCIGLANHCCNEYARLADILPHVYAENHDVEDKPEDFLPFGYRDQDVFF